MIIFLLLLAQSAYADTEFLLGGLTYHVNGNDVAASRYSNKVSGNGELILTPTLGIVKTKDDGKTFSSWVEFAGESSVGGAMVGGLREIGWSFGHLQVGGVLGVYLQDDAAFDRRDIGPFELAKVGGIGVVPIAGAVVNYSAPVAQSVYLKLNNIISPVILNTSISLGFKF